MYRRIEQEHSKNGLYIKCQLDQQAGTSSHTRLFKAVRHVTKQDEMKHLNFVLFWKNARF